jgi:hypothetical protein
MTNHFFLNLTHDSKITGIKGDGNQAWLSGNRSETERFHTLDNGLYEALWKGVRLWPTDVEFGNFSFELKKSAKPTSFVSFGPHFFGVKFLVDFSAKEAFSKLNIQKHRMYPTSVCSKAGNLDYWMFYTHRLDYEVVDFDRSTFYTGNQFIGRTTYRYGSSDEYRAALSVYEGKLRPDIIALSQDTDQTFDLYQLPTEGRFIVSSRFKEQLERVGCVGHSLFPIESSIEGGALQFKIPLL